MTPFGKWAFSYTDKKTRDEAAQAAEYAYEHRYGALDLDALGYDPTQTDGGKKLLDAVTYDDDGNVIPLSQRFNPEVEDVRYSLPKSKKADTDGYDTTKIHWAIKAGIIDRANQRAFWEQIANIRKLWYYNITTDDGEYAIKAGNAIMFTDADYKAPSLTSVIVVKAPDKRMQDYVVRWIIDEISESGSVEYAYELVSSVYGQGIVSWYHQKDFYSYDWENGQREGNDGRGADSESGSRGIRHRNKLPVGEDSSPRALLSNAFEELAKTDMEREYIRKYRERVVQFQELEAKLKDLRAQIRELYTADGKLDTKKIRELQFEANATANRIETLDRMLLRTESTQQFQNVLKREQDQARAREIKKAKDAVIAFRHDASAEIRETNPAAGKNDSETFNGIFFNTNDHDIGFGGGIQMEVSVFIGLTQQYDKLVFVEVTLSLPRPVCALVSQRQGTWRQSDKHQFDGC